jgi:hypothetical protein
MFARHVKTSTIAVVLIGLAGTANSVWTVASLPWGKAPATVSSLWNGEPGDEATARMQQYAKIRQVLLELNHRGAVGFLSDSDRDADLYTFDYYLAQSALVPHIVHKDSRSDDYVVGAFRRSENYRNLPDLEPVAEVAGAVVLFRRRR